MFGKLKNKLKEWTKKVSEVEDEEELKTPKEEVQEKSKLVTKTEDKALKKKAKKKKKEPTDQDLKEELEKGEYIEPEVEFNAGTQKYEASTEKTKKSFLKKLTSSKKTISQKEFDEHALDLEMILLENNVALEVVDKILEKLKSEIVGKEMSKKEIHEKIIENLKEIVKEVLVEPFDIFAEIKNKKPYVILFCGINGTGKTTTIAKFTNMLKEKGLTCALAAGDTFRAAAVEQLKVHGKKLDVKVLSQDYGADPAAVGFDAIKYAEKNNIDVVLIDTAGRIHTATNLIKELEKIKKVCSPDRTIFVGESITGNDATDQVKAFNENIGIDGIILSKADIDEKGGTALSVGFTTKKPILYLGKGQEYKDLEKFDKQKFIEKLGLN